MRAKAKQLAYKRPDGQHTVAQLVAHFLNFYAHQAPRDPVGYHVMTKHILNYARVPTMHSKEVEMVRSAMSRAKKILREQYGREVISIRNIGVRASYDEEDKLKNALPPQVVAAERRLAAVQTTIDNIDLTKVPATPENKKWIDWMKRDVRDALKLAGSLQKARAALPEVSTVPATPGT